MITGPFKHQVDEIWTTFWNNGISNPLSVIEQISYLLFIKRLDDLDLAAERKAQRLSRPVDKPRFGPDQQHMRWSRFKNLGDGEEMLQLIRDEVFPFIKNLGGTGDATSYARHMKDAVFLITSPALISSVVDQMDRLPLEDRDTKGDLYEYMLSKLTTAGTNGQFRTPRHLIKMMVDLMEPQAEDIICDPACGTAGFLMGAAEYLRELKDDKGNLVLNARGNREHFDTEMFHGFDFDSTMLRIGSMNMMLHGLENPNIEAKDTLAQTSREAAVFAALEGRVSLVMANPPFKGSVDVAFVADDLLRATGQSAKKKQSASKTKDGKKKGPSAKTELLFLSLMLRLLRVGGRAAVVVPDGVLFGSSKAHKAVRKALVEDHKLDGVISMPSGVFKPYSGVSTAVLLFTKTGAGGTDHVWFYDMQADGLSLDDKRELVKDNDIPDVLSRWKERNPEADIDRKDKAFFVPVDEIQEGGAYELSLKRYKEVEYEEVVYDPPTVIIGKLRALEAEISQELDELDGML